MSKIRINSISVKNYRSFGEQQNFVFPPSDYKKPVAIVGYNNSGKTNLMNAILYGLNYNFVSKDTFALNDFHNRKIENEPYLLLNASSSSEQKFDGEKRANLTGYHRLKIFVDGDEIEGSKIESLKSLDPVTRYNGDVVDDTNWDAFGATRYFNIFFINFHNIKEEIVTNKTSWGNIKSFLGKHIQKVVDSDDSMLEKKEAFNNALLDSTDEVLEGSKLQEFIQKIKVNYTNNLRDNDCEVKFGLPNYEDIFLQMMFMIGLNGDKENLVPINHFGDGYISMFVMAVIQAIAETNTEDECLFLFEEPESFLHENHQEYFYKTVLCGLAEKGHQVIYTTHSDKMIDPFDTKGLIRLEQDEKNQTICKYNETKEFTPEQIDEDTGEIINMSRYNEFIKTIEPNLNRILFSKKVILVEGPNDVLVYKTAIKNKVLELVQDNAEIINKERYAETYLNFHNISIICHHGKGTAQYLIQLCEWFKLDYYVINDWDFETNFIADVSKSFDELKALPVWASIAQEKNSKGENYSEATLKKMIGTNRNLVASAKEGQIHFNVKKLETVIGYESNDKNSLSIWELLNSDDFAFDTQLFPESLERFLELKESEPDEIIAEEENDLPF